MAVGSKYHPPTDVERRLIYELASVLAAFRDLRAGYPEDALHAPADEIEENAAEALRMANVEDY